jgi:hypothetical protein
MMKISRRLGWACLPAVVLAFGSVAVASGSPDRPVKTPVKTTPVVAGTARVVGTGTRTTAGASFGSRSTSILGAAWNIDNSPIKGANLRLRNVVSGKVEAIAKANDVGQFAFENIEGGSYVVELVSEAGKIQTVGHVFTIAPGETVATFVRLGTKVPWGTAFFSNTASSVASAAASEGITAIAPLALCSSPPCNH